MLFAQVPHEPVPVRLAAAAGRSWSAAAPAGSVRAAVTAAGGRLRLTVTRAGHVALRADLGDAPAGELRARREAVHERFHTPSGKRRVHRLDARRLTLTGRGGRGVQILAARGGAAFRLLRAGPERTVLHAPAGTRAWLQNYRADYENPYVPGALAGYAPQERYAFPALLRTDGRYTLLTEAGAERAAVSHLKLYPHGHGALHVDLPPSEPAPARTPWRVMVLGSLADIVASDLPLALGSPSRIRDPSWITPGRAAWSWWSDPRSATSLERQRDYVDAAAAAGWEYVTVDAGWNPAWAPGLATYAARRGVKLILWLDWHDLSTPAERERVLSLLAAWGVAGIKVDFLLSDHAPQIRAMDDIARAAATRRLVVDFHGCTVPRGIQRTWPNVLTLEGVQGAEHAMLEPLSPAHNVNLVFTRNVIGGMDYTPVTFSAPGRVTSDGQELAESVVFESGLQHFADTPESYARHPVAAAFLRAVPAAWDDTRLVSGRPDSHAVVARRSGDRWFVGGIVAGGRRSLDVPLRFLSEGVYAAQVISDGPHGGLVSRDAPVGRITTLKVPVARNGGFVVELTPAS